MSGVDPAQQIEEWPGALVGELQISRRDPRLGISFDDGRPHASSARWASRRETSPASVGVRLALRLLQRVQAATVFFQLLVPPRD